MNLKQERFERFNSPSPLNPFVNNAGVFNFEGFVRVRYGETEGAAMIAERNIWLEEIQSLPEPSFRKVKKEKDDLYSGLLWGLQPYGLW